MVMIPPMRPIDLDPQEYVRRRDEQPAPLLVDCREEWEFELVHLEGARLMPLSTWSEDAARELGDAEVVVYCHHGIRSRRAVALLRHAGVANSQSLAGGIDRWSLEIDPSVARY